MATYLERYKAGEFEQVWSELIGQGESVRNGPLYFDAIAVARETMHRVGYNIRLILQRLRMMDYVFVYPEKTFVPPAQHVTSQINELETSIGVIPLSLRAWYEIVGSVRLVGSHPALASYGTYGAPSGFRPHPEGSERGCYSDPLWIESIEYILQDHRAFTEIGYPAVDADGQTSLELAPDIFHKSNISGGVPYCIQVPNPGMDAMLENEEHHLHLVEYLRLSFRYGGFPGFDLYGKTKFNTILSEVPTEELARLSQGLLPI